LWTLLLEISGRGIFWDEEEKVKLKLGFSFCWTQVATITSALLVDRCGRRLLLMLSQGFMGISMSGMGAYFFLKNHNDPQNPFPLDELSWLPLTCLLIFVVAFSIGIGPIST